MNKTIKKLIEQSGTDVSGKWMRLDQVEKYTELLIEECRVALRPMLRDMISRGKAHDLIKEHFSPGETTLREMVYSEEYDSYYNEITNEWIEDMCSDPECLYCKDRPERPEKPLNEPV